MRAAAVAFRSLGPTAWAGVAATLSAAAVAASDVIRMKFMSYSPLVWRLADALTGHPWRAY
jgi:hypothetical protein